MKTLATILMVLMVAGTALAERGYGIGAGYIAASTGTVLTAANTYTDGATNAAIEAAATAAADMTNGCYLADGTRVGTASGLTNFPWYYGSGSANPTNEDTLCRFGFLNTGGGIHVTNVGARVRGDMWVGSLCCTIGNDEANCTTNVEAFEVSDSTIATNWARDVWLPGGERLFWQTITNGMTTNLAVTGSGTYW